MGLSLDGFRKHLVLDPPVSVENQFFYLIIGDPQPESQVSGLPKV